MTRSNNGFHRGDVITGYIALILVICFITGAMTWFFAALWALYKIAMLAASL